MPAPARAGAHGEPVSSKEPGFREWHSPVVRSRQSPGCRPTRCRRAWPGVAGATGVNFLRNAGRVKEFSLTRRGKRREATPLTTLTPADGDRTTPTQLGPWLTVTAAPGGQRGTQQGAARALRSCVSRFRRGAERVSLSHRYYRGNLHGSGSQKVAGYFRSSGRFEYPPARIGFLYAEARDRVWAESEEMGALY